MDIVAVEKMCNEMHIVHINSHVLSNDRILCENIY
jgi:hypothetical protein